MADLISPGFLKTLSFAIGVTKSYFYLSYIIYYNIGDYGWESGIDTFFYTLFLSESILLYYYDCYYIFIGFGNYFIFIFDYFDF